MSVSGYQGSGWDSTLVLPRDRVSLGIQVAQVDLQVPSGLDDPVTLEVRLFLVHPKQRVDDEEETKEGQKDCSTHSNGRNASQLRTCHAQDKNLV